MEQRVEQVDEVTVRLTVEVEPERVKDAFDRAARELSRQVRIPGFRPGRVPRPILEQRVGSGAIASAALDAVLPDLYSEAVRAAGIIVVAPPELDVTRFDEAEGAEFTATVEVLPEVEAPEHRGVAATSPAWEVSDAEVDEQLEGLRERFAEVDVVERPAAAGDLVTLRMAVEVDGTELEDAAVDGALYEVGSGGVTAALDREVLGASAGDELDYTDELPAGYPEHGGATARFRVTVLDVREKRLPELDDDFAATAAALDTLEELRADLRRSLLRRRVTEARHGLRAQLVETYVDLVEVAVPPRLVRAEVDDRWRELERQAGSIGVGVDALLAAEDLTRDAWESRLTEQVARGVKARIVLDALAARLELRAEPGDLEREIVRHAQAGGMDPAQLAAAIRDDGTLPVLVGDVVRRKAIDAIVAAATVEGAPPTELLVELGLEDAPADEPPPADEPQPDDEPPADASDEPPTADASDEPAGA